MITITNKKKFSAVVCIGIALIVYILFRFIWGSGEIRKTGDIQIAQGEKATDVWRMLVNEGYSDRTIPWKYYGRNNNNATKIQAGEYRVEAGENISVVLDRFVRGEANKNEQSVTFPEGFTEAQVATRAADRQGTTAKEFLQYATPSVYKEKFSFLATLAKTRTLEGYLFPDTYRIAKDDTSKDVIVRMLANFDKKVTPELREEAKTQHRTLDQIVIMASIIEKEVPHPQDMPIVAGIFWKRLDEGQGMYADSTIRYALKNSDELTVQDLATDSPYNTRRYKGLPPGPISNPGISAILAAIRPQATDYYYYLTDKNDTAIYAKTNEEHNRNKVKYL